MSTYPIRVALKVRVRNTRSRFFLKRLFIPLSSIEGPGSMGGILLYFMSFSGCYPAPIMRSTTLHKGNTEPVCNYGSESLIDSDTAPELLASLYCQINRFRRVQANTKRHPTTCLLFQYLKKPYLIASTPSQPSLTPIPTIHPQPPSPTPCQPPNPISTHRRSHPGWLQVPHPLQAYPLESSLPLYQTCRCQ